jgi:hypothetical protein
MRTALARALTSTALVAAALCLTACTSSGAGSQSTGDVAPSVSRQDQPVCTAVLKKIATMNDALLAFDHSTTRATANQLRAVNVAIVNLGATAQQQAKLASPALKAQLIAVASKVSPLELALSGQGGSDAVTSSEFLKAAQAVDTTCTGQR